MKRSNIIALIFILLLTSCGPTMHLQRLKPAEVDMSDMRRLAVLDFDYYPGKIDSIGDLVVGIIVRSAGLDYGDDYQIREAALYATDTLITALQDTKYFNIVDSPELSQVNLQNTEDVEKIKRTLGVNAILTGRLNYSDCQQDKFTKEEKVYDSIKKQEVIGLIPWVRQNCRLSLSYRITKTTDNTLVIRKSFSDNREEAVSVSNLSNLHDPGHWYQQMIDGIIPKIVRQLAPYTITETRFLKVDKTYDAEMKRASALAKAGNFTQARDIFLQRWHATTNLAAGYNAAILYEVEGDLEKAIKLLGEIINIYSDHSVINEHRRVIEALKERRQAEKQLRESATTQ